MSEREDLTAILRDDHESVLRNRLPGYETVADEQLDIKAGIEIRSAVTRGPSGRHYAWTYHSGSNDDELLMPPRPVRPVPKMVVEWVNDDRPLGVADVERFTATVGFARAQMYQEAAASVALDRDERAQTYSVDLPESERD